MANLSSTRIFGDGTVERSLYVKQRLGVGVGNPSAKLDVDGIMRVVPGDDQPLKVQSGTSGDELIMGGNEIEATTSLYIQNDSGNETYFTGGNVGINTAGPGERLDVNGNIGIRNGSILKFYTSDNARQRADARDEGSQSRLHWYGKNDSGNTRNARHAFYDGNSYVNFEAQGNAIRMDGLDIEGRNDPGHINRDGAFYRTSGQAFITVDDKLYIRNQNGGGGESGQFLFNVDSGRFYLDGGGNIALSEDPSNGNLRVDNGSGSYQEIEAQDYYIHEDNLWLGDHVDNDDAHHPDHRDSVEYIDFSNNERADYDGQDGKLYWDLSEGLYISSSNSKTGSTSVLQWSRSNVTAGSNVSVNYDSRGRPTISASGGGNTYTDSDASLISGSSVSKNINGVGSGAPNARGYQVDWDSDFAFFGLVDLGSNNKHLAIANEEPSDDFRFYTAANNIVTIVASSGTIRADGDVIAYYSSDRRLKKNPTKVENPMAKIEKLTGVGFDWKNGASRDGSGFGVFAQDAKKIDERLVREQGDGYLGVDYQQLHGIEIEALKQVNEKVEENQSEIQRLKQRIAKLESNDNAI